MGMSATAILRESIDEEVENEIIEMFDYELMAKENISDLNEHMGNMGILVVRHTNYSNYQIATKLNMSVTVTEQENSLDDASLFYAYGDGKQGTYIINTPTNSVTVIDEMITEAIEIIRNRQITYQANQINDSNSAVSLGIVEVTTAVAPKGKLRASYEVFTVQDYHELDFYVVKANIAGLPGCVLAGSNSEYNRAYEIENLTAEISTPTSSTTLDAYGPHRTIGSSSYSVDVSMSVDSDDTIGITGGWSYSRNIEDTDINAGCTEKKHRGMLN